MAEIETVKQPSQNSNLEVDLGEKVPWSTAQPMDGGAENVGDGVPDRQTGEESVDVPAEKLETALREARENYDRFLRVSAEFDNFKKRTAREVQDFRKFANESLLRDLLPVVDNLERALAVAPDAQKEGGLREGIELTLKQLYKLLEGAVVLPIEAEGNPFDPAFHQAMMQEPSDQVPDNTVIRQMQKGYTIHGRLLRPAMVVVAKAAAKGGDASPAADEAEAQG
jgi:molecular chaperone GrpE